MARVLLIEHDPVVRDLLGLQLTREGHVVLTAPDGQRGVDSARTEEPDLVVLDLALPGMGSPVARHFGRSMTSQFCSLPNGVMGRTGSQDWTLALTTMW